MSARRLPITLRPSSVVVLMLILSLLLGATAVPGHALTPQSAEGYGTPATPHSPLLAPNQCAPPPSDIVAWWPLDEQTGAVAADIIGSNDGAHQNGPTPVPGMVDYALSFDGVNDYVVVDDDPALDFGTGDFSIEAWIEGTRSTANIVSKRSSHGNPGYLLMLYSGHLLLQMSDDVDGWYNFYSPGTPNLADGNWHHVAVTVDRDASNGGRMYADGDLIFTFNPTRRSGNMDSPAPLRIGVEDGVKKYFKGKIDEVSLYKRALTATEVQAIFSAGSLGKCKISNQCVPPPSNIVAWWPLDEQAGAVAADIIGSNDGAHQNGPTPVPGMVDYALSFDGVDDNVVVNDDPALDFGTGDFSIEAWIEGTRSTANIVSKRTSHGNPGYLLMLYSGHLLLQMSDDVDGWYNFYSPGTPNLADGNWHHVAVTVDRDDPEGGRMYADGEPIYTFNPTRRSGNMDSPAPLRVGVEGVRNHFKGKIDEVSLYKRALTATEVQAIFNADSLGKCKPSPSGVFVDSGQRLGAASSYAVALGDLDGDGDLDALVANETSSNKVWLNDGTGLFIDSGQQLGGDWSYDVDLGDVDSDGDLDALIVVPSEGNSVWLNNGIGGFVDSGQRLGSDFVSSGVAGALRDVDSDGDLDVFVVNLLWAGWPVGLRQYTYKVWLNNGVGIFSGGSEREGNEHSGVAVEDVDNDGDLDAFVLNANTTGPNEVWLNNGGGSFNNSGQHLGDSSSWGVALGDLDSDADLDAFVANSSYSSTPASNRVWLNDGSGSFSNSGQSLGRSFSYAVALDDVDGDGDLDAFVANIGANTVWLNDGAGAFSDSHQQLGSSSSRDVVLGDVDGDGDVDAFVANDGANTVWLNVDAVPLVLSQ